MSTVPVVHLPPIANRRVARLMAEAARGIPGKAAELLTRNEAVRYAQTIAKDAGLGQPIVYTRLNRNQAFMVIRAAFDRKRPAPPAYSEFAQDPKGALVVRYRTATKGGAA